jgi:hypothetical protein
MIFCVPNLALFKTHWSGTKGIELELLMDQENQQFYESKRSRIVSLLSNIRPHILC